MGDVCTKEFFQAHKDQGSGARITELEDSSGASYNDQQMLERICSDYFASLYIARPPSTSQAEAKAACLSNIQDKLTPSMKGALKRPISLRELKDALKVMDSSKAPGLNGVVTSSYKKFWDLIKKDYHEMITTAI